MRYDFTRYIPWYLQLETCPQGLWLEEFGDVAGALAGAALIGWYPGFASEVGGGSGSSSIKPQRPPTEEIEDGCHRASRLRTTGFRFSSRATL